MKVTRLRELTHDYPAFAGISPAVEMKVTRLRELTHLGRTEHGSCRVCRNEGYPIKGIDTHDRFLQTIYPHNVEMKVTRLRELTHCHKAPPFLQQ